MTRKKSKSPAMIATQNVRLRHREEARKILASLGVNKKQAKGLKVFNLAMTYLTDGVLPKDIPALINESSQLAGYRAAERKAELIRQNEATERQHMREAAYAMSGLGVTTKQHLGIEVWERVKKMARGGYDSGAIQEHLRDNPMVIESVRVTREKKAEAERLFQEKHAERLRTRVDMREVLKYLAEKEGKSYTPPEDPKPKERVIPHKPARSSDIKTGLPGKPSITNENPRTYDLPNLPIHTSGFNTKNLDEARQLVGVRYREFLQYHIRNKANGLDAHAQAVEFMKQFAPAPVATPPTPEPDPVVAPVEAPKPAAKPAPVAAAVKQATPRADVEISASGSVREVFQRDAAAQAQFRKLVLENFGERCAVTGKRLNGVLEAAHIEGAAVEGCYNASNGILLAPTFHKLYDRHMMGINPETMTVHFAPGIEWEEYEGKVITPLLYALDKERLAARWEQFKGSNK